MQSLSESLGKGLKYRWEDNIIMGCREWIWTWFSWLWIGPSKLCSEPSGSMKDGENFLTLERQRAFQGHCSIDTHTLHWCIRYKVNRICVRGHMFCLHILAILLLPCWPLVDSEESPLLYFGCSTSSWNGVGAVTLAIPWWGSVRWGSMGLREVIKMRILISQ
jgi:hypothetical protein